MPNIATRLLLDEDTRHTLWERLKEHIEHYLIEVGRARVAPPLNPTTLRQTIRRFDFGETLDPLNLLDTVTEQLWQHQVHTPHPRYFGLFNPAVTAMGIAADALVATFNPQLAAWSHSPFAVEIEQHLVQAFAARFGYDAASADGTFTSGGAEANHTALLSALIHQFPDFARAGLRVLDAQPVMYASSLSHHSLVKAARFCGLGTDALRSIPVDNQFHMDVNVLRAQIPRDKAASLEPFMVVATAGTTSAGTLDPLPEIAAIAREEKLWLHVDSAWGGLAMMIPELRTLLAGIEQADSITFDAHKSLSVPMSAGLYLSRHTSILEQVCRITTDYMPHDATQFDVVDPYGHSLQWSRRFIGLKVFLSLAAAGWEGYASALRHQVAMGDMLRDRLVANGWRVINPTQLPVVCFVDTIHKAGESVSYLDHIAEHIVTSGKAWLSTTRLGADFPVLRACITNYRTMPEDIDALIVCLNDARKAVSD